MILVQDMPFTDSSKIIDGWIFSDSKRLFWVPPLLRAGLMRPNNLLVIGNVITTRLDLDTFKYGEDWTKCRINQDL